jgi:hypothetical protein
LLVDIKWLLIYVNLSLFPVASTLEHRASVKRFVSLQFLNPGRTPWAGNQPVARPIYVDQILKWTQRCMTSYTRNFTVQRIVVPLWT